MRGSERIYFGKQARLTKRPVQLNMLTTTSDKASRSGSRSPAGAGWRGCKSADNQNRDGFMQGASSHTLVAARAGELLWRRAFRGDMFVGRSKKKARSLLERPLNAAVLVPWPGVCAWAPATSASAANATIAAVFICDRASAAQPRSDR